MYDPLTIPKPSHCGKPSCRGRGIHLVVATGIQVVGQWENRFGVACYVRKPYENPICFVRNISQFSFPGFFPGFFLGGIRIHHFLSGLSTSGWTAPAIGFSGPRPPQHHRRRGGDVLSAQILTTEWLKWSVPTNGDTMNWRPSWFHIHSYFMVYDVYNIYKYVMLWW